MNKLCRGGSARRDRKPLIYLRNPPGCIEEVLQPYRIADGHVKVPTIRVVDVHRSGRGDRHVAQHGTEHPFHGEAEPMARNVRRNLSVSSPK